MSRMTRSISISASFESAGQDQHVGEGAGRASQGAGWNQRNPASAGTAEEHFSRPGGEGRASPEGWELPEGTQRGR